MRNAHKVCIGRDQKGNKIFLRPEERLIHTHVIGSPIRGKSCFLELVTRKDILFRHGLCYIDPHGTSYYNLLQWLESTGMHRNRKIHLIDPSNADWAVAFNPLAIDMTDDMKGKARLDYVISSIVKVFMQIWGSENSDQTPLLERILTLGLYAVALNKLTILELPEVVSSIDIDTTRRRITANLGDWYLQQQWDELNSTKAREFREMCFSTHNRLSRLMTSPVLRAVLGQREGVLDIRGIMERGEILLVSLSTGEGMISHERARIIGGLLINDIFLKGEMRPKGSRPFFVTIDECHRFLNSDIEAMLNESRKRGIGVTLAHQTLGQLRKAGDAVYSGVMGSAQTKVVFGLAGMEDAETMASQILSVDMEEPKQSIVTYQTVGHRKVSLRQGSTTTGWNKAKGTQESYTYGKGRTVQIGQSVTHIQGDSEGRVVGVGMTQSSSQTEAGDIVLFYQGQSANESDFHSTFSARAAGKSYSVSNSRNRDHSIGFSEQHGVSGSSTSGWAEALMPVIEEFRQTMFTLEEQIRRAAEGIRDMLPAHALLKRPFEKCFPVTISKVRDGHARISRVIRLVNSLFGKQESALPLEEAYGIVEERHNRLIEKSKTDNTGDEPTNFLTT